MSLRLEAVRLTVNTANGQLMYATQFGDGLNVIAAPNSFGKSTLFQSIIYALGLEGMLSASHASPVGPAMNTVVDLPDGSREHVIDSHVELIMTNRAGHRMAVRRYVHSLDIDTNLVQVWRGPSDINIGDGERLDTFVRLAGSAVSELGFQRVLAEFLQWSMPLVPTYSDTDVPLYLEALFPLFYVEQKSGWSGISPKMPTYLRIKDMLTRSVEFVLGLGTLERLRALESIKREQADIRREWREGLAKASAMAAAEGLRLGPVQDAPLPTDELRELELLALSASGEWTTLSAQQGEWARSLTDLNVEEPVTTGDRAPVAQAQLAQAEVEFRELASNLNHLNEQRLLLQGDIDSIAARIGSVEADRRRLRDVVTLRRLGSDLDVELFEHDSCPTCHQVLGGRVIEGDAVASVETTLDLAGAERVTLDHMRAAAVERESTLSTATNAMADRMNELRALIRTLKDELTAPSLTPSIADIQRRLVLEGRLEATERASALVASVDDALAALADRWTDMRVRERALRDQSAVAADQEAIRRFESRFVDQLGLYGLSSLPATQVAIDQNTLTPVNDGVELSFDLALGMSASDTIRTKWAYHLALLETTRGDSRARHANLLMFDEPRQQEASRLDLRAFIERLGALGDGCQVLYATSEEPETLAQLLRGVPHLMLNAGGGHLLSPVVE